MWGKRASVAPTPTPSAVNEPHSNLQKAVLKAFQNGKVPEYLKRKPYNGNNTPEEHIIMTNPDDLIPNKLYRINDHPFRYKFIKRINDDLYFQIVYTHEVIKMNKHYIGKVVNKGNVVIFDQNNMSVPAYDVVNFNGKTYRINANKMPRSRKKSRKTRRKTRR